MGSEATLVPAERIERMILLVRDEKVMLDADLAELYGVETGALNRAVKRNIARFPGDFMFQLTEEEAGILRCQSGTSDAGGQPKPADLTPQPVTSSWGGRRYPPYAFTE